MNQVTIDASLAITWILAEQPHLSRTTALLAEWVRRRIRLIVPGWFGCEVANVLYQRVHGGSLSMADAQANLTAIFAAVTVVDVEPETAVRAIAIAAEIGEKATHDAQYLALAELLDCQLWTADQRFWNAARSRFPRLQWIGAYQPGTR